MDRVWAMATERKKGVGSQYWVGVGLPVGLILPQSAMGLKCLLTDWCLVTVMVGMGELSA